MKSQLLEIGAKYGLLTIIKLNHIKYKIINRSNGRIENQKKEYYLCKCDCGNYIIVSRNNLISNHTKSCGCYAKKKCSEIGKKNMKYNCRNNRLYKILDGMKSRCYRKSNLENYNRYGGRGVKICKEWLDKEKGFENFYNWAINNGYKDGLSIDRIDNNGNYEPSNCRWVNNIIQMRNMRNNRIIEYKGKKYCVIELYEYLKPKCSISFFYKKTYKIKTKQEMERLIDTIMEFGMENNIQDCWLNDGEKMEILNSYNG